MNSLSFTRQQQQQRIERSGGVTESEALCARLRWIYIKDIREGLSENVIVWSVLSLSRRIYDMERWINLLIYRFQFLVIGRWSCEDVVAGLYGEAEWLKNKSLERLFPTHRCRNRFFILFYCTFVAFSGQLLLAPHQQWK